MNEQPEEIELQDEETVDPSHDLDLVSVFEAMGAEAEMEAMAVKGVLDAAGLNAVMISSSPLPSLTYSVRVPAEEQEAALQRIEEARAAGPAAAEEAERATEEQTEPPPAPES